MANTKMEFRGGKEMEKLLKQLPQKTGRRVMLSALRKAAKPVLDEAIARAPLGQESKGRIRLRRSRSGPVTVSNFGKLRFSLALKNVPPRLSRHSAAVVVTTGKAFWGRFLEFGTRFITKRPFLRPAFDNNVARSLEILRAEVSKQLAKAVEKLAKPNRIKARR